MMALISASAGQFNRDVLADFEVAHANLPGRLRGFYYGRLAYGGALPRRTRFPESVPRNQIRAPVPFLRMGLRVLCDDCRHLSDGHRF